MTDQVAASSRAAAERLSSEFGTELMADVEAALHTRGTESSREQYVDPISLAGLIVSIASVAWTVYNDRKRMGPPPAPEVVARAVHVELRTTTNISTEVRELVIAVVVDETIATSNRESPPAESG